MKWSIGDILSLISIITTVVSVSTATAVFMLKFGQITNEVKNLGIRVDKLEVRMDKVEKKLDEVLFFLSRKFKKRRWKRT